MITRRGIFGLIAAIFGRKPIAALAPSEISAGYISSASLKALMDHRTNVMALFNKGEVATIGDGDFRIPISFTSPLPALPAPPDQKHGG